MGLFFQVLFMIAGILLIIENIRIISRWQESRKEGSVRPYSVKWFNFILTSLVALGCVINIVLRWMNV